jgi:hypothetical protein
VIEDGNVANAKFFFVKIQFSFQASGILTPDFFSRSDGNQSKNYITQQEYQVIFLTGSP